MQQKFDFGFEAEDTIEGMKKLIVEEVISFRNVVRAQARAAGQVRKQDRFVLCLDASLILSISLLFPVAFLFHPGTKL
jgi:hypothetical protein